MGMGTGKGPNGRRAFPRRLENGVPGELSGGGREMDNKGNSAILSKIWGVEMGGKAGKGNPWKP
jgi:hypothetical protein